MYKLAHYLRDKLPFIWDFVDWLNGLLFTLLYRERAKKLPNVLKEYSKDLEIVSLSDCKVSDLEQFFVAQPEESFKYFKPHGFDAQSLRKLQRNKAFLAYVVKSEDKIAGYFFLRSFFIGKAYLGKMVDCNHQGQGIGKMMCLCAMDMAETLGLRMFETISRDNPASLHSSDSVLVTRIFKELPDNYLYIEDIRKKDVA